MRQKPLILIDWYRTLSEEIFWGDFVSTEILTAIQGEVIKDKTTIDAWMRGQISSEDICDKLSEKVPLGTAELLEKLRQSCELMELDQEMAAVLAELSARFNIALVTDNMDCFDRWTVPKLKKLGCFSRIDVSSSVRRLKNDDEGRTLLDVCSAFGAKPDEVILIDDSASTRTLFESMGGQTRTIRNPMDTKKVISDFLIELGSDLES
ncbi:MAG: hypothetical protein V1821_03175 [bacterium]